MTAQAFEIDGRRGRRKATRQRLPRDLVILILTLIALYVAARMAPPPEPRQAPLPPAPPQAPITIPILPPPPSLDGALTPRARRGAPEHVLPAGPEIETADHDPFEGLERLSAAELDGISQAR